jgi:DNA-binding NtrC family response regulator
MSVKLERVLVLDDDASVREALAGFLKREGYDASPVATVAEAKALIAAQSFDLLLADLILAGGDLSLGFLREVRQLRPKLPIIILTGHASMDSAIEAIKIGIFDYLLKPINADELRIALARLESIEQMRAENTYLRQEVAKGSSRTPPSWGTSEPMQEVLRLIEAAATTEACVLIQGPGGSGKSSVAHAIFQKSSAQENPSCELIATSRPSAV